MAELEKPARRNPLISKVKNLIRVPLVGQARDYTCGIAAMLSVLIYLDTGQDDYEIKLIRPLIKKEKDGVLSRDLIKYANRQGFKTYRKEHMPPEELEGFIERKEPVLVLLQAWPDNGPPQKGWENDWRDGHWSVVVGFDKRNYYFMDPSTVGNYTYIPKAEFLRRWHDWDGSKKVKHLGVVIQNSPSYDPRVAVRLD